MIWRKHIHEVVLRLPDSWSNWNLGMLVFEERGKPEYGEKPLGSRERTNNKLIIIFFFRRQRHNPSSTKQKSSFFRTDCTWRLMKRSEERKLFTWLVHGAKCTGAGFFFGLLWQLMQLMFSILFCNKKLDL